jgi:DNA-directed RNA polymerase subunit RPC12/RpoP
MSYEICDACGKSGETDNDEGGRFERGPLYVHTRYICSRCVAAEIAAEDVDGDPYEELLIKEREK